MFFKDKTLLILLGITLLGLILRAYKLTSSPAGLYIDETSIGYNAYSLITTGRDEHGKFMPPFFEAFGEYKLPIYVYLVAATQLFLGPTDLSVRLPAVVFGTLTILVIFLFAIELLKNNSNEIIKKIVPFLCAFLLAVSPWHLQFSRPGFEVSVALFLFVLALYLFFRALNQKSGLTLIFSILSFVLTLYTYNSFRIVIPLTFSILAIFYFKKFTKLDWIKAISLGLIVALPFIFFSTSPAGLARAKQISIFYQPTEFPIWQQFFLNYLVNTSPYYLFVKGDPTIGHATVHRMSLVYVAELPFFIAGFLVLIKKKSSNYLTVIFLFLIGFVPAALAMANPWYQPHALRALLALPASILISALGFSFIVHKIGREKFQKIFLIVFISIISTSTLRFLNTYHQKYAIDAGWDWLVGEKRVSLEISKIQDYYDNVFFANGVSRMAILWHLKYNPGDYQLASDKNNLGKYHFAIDYLDLIPKTGRNIYITGVSDVPDGQLLDYVYYPNGQIAYGIWEI